MVASAASTHGRLGAAIVAIAIALQAGHGLARAETPPKTVTARLEYTADPVCPPETDLRSAVAQRLGADPFRTEAAARVRAHIARDENGFSADVAFDDPSGRHGERRLSTPGDDCRELAMTVALTIAIMVDPRTFGPPPPVATPTREPAIVRPPEEPPAPRDVPAPTGEPNPPTTRLRFGIGPVLAVGSAPAPAFGVLLFAGAALRRASIDVEGRVDLPASLERSSGVSIASSLLVGSVVPCLWLGDFRACALASAGAMRGEARGGGASDQQTTFFAAFGGRIGYELGLSKGFGVRARLDLSAPLTPTSFALDGTNQWTTPPLAAAAGIDAVGTIL